MATKTKTNFEAVGLTSHMPDVVVITTDAVSLEIMVYVNGSLVFDSDYYPFQGKVNFRDIREIVETAMLEKKLALATLTLTAKETRSTGSGSTEWQQEDLRPTGNGRTTPRHNWRHHDRMIRSHR